MPEVVSNIENVEFVREEVIKLLPRYTLIRDVINEDVKSKGEAYLPDPSERPFSSRDDEEKHRYKNYILRAQFINFTGRTQGGFVGQIFARSPEIEVPPSLEPMVQDATGDGLSLEQLCKDVAADVLSLGRYGLFADYPSIGEGVTPEMIKTGEVRPVILPYTPENIINWRTTRRNALNILSMVVLKEKYVLRDDGFEAVFEEQFRVLDLDIDGLYRCRVWRKADGWGDRTSEPLVNGARSNTIPFTFVGSINNDPTPDNPPMFDMANLNIGHYRNSADYEESVFLCGQPTFVVTGMTEKWLKSVFNGIIRWGSRFGLAFEKESRAEILQAEPNTLAKEAMDQKQEQIGAMGADFMRAQNVAQTATEAAIDDSSRTSMISNTADNITAAMLFILKWAARYQGESEESIKFSLNSEFDLAVLSAQDIDSLIKLGDSDYLSFKEVRDQLRKAGKATEDDAVVLKEREEKQARELERAASEFAIANPVDNPNGDV